MNETGLGAGEDKSRTSRVMLGSTLCLTIETILHGTGKLTKNPFVIVAQSSATLDPHIIRRVLPLPGVSSRVCGSSLENPLHIALHRGVTAATGKAYAQQRSFLPHYRSADRATLLRSYGATGKCQGTAAKRPPS